MITALANLLNSGLSLIKDKGDKFKVTEKVKGVSISSKRVLNFAGTSIILGAALADISASGITTQNLILVSIGVAYSVAMSVLAKT